MIENWPDKSIFPSCFLFSVQRSLSINTRSTGRELRISLNSSKGFSSSRLFAWCLLHQGSQSTIISTSWSSFSRSVSSTDPRIRCHISRLPYSIAVSRGDWPLQSLFGSNLPNIQNQSFSFPFNKKQSSPSVKKQTHMSLQASDHGGVKQKTIMTKLFPLDLSLFFSPCTGLSDYLLKGLEKLFESCN